MPPNDQSHLIEYRVQMLEGVVGEIRDALRAIERTLHELSSLERAHTEMGARLGQRIDDHEQRVRQLERWQLGWAGVLSVLAIAGPLALTHFAGRF